MEHFSAIAAALALSVALPVAAQTIGPANLIHLSGTTIVPNYSGWSFQGTGASAAQPFLSGNAVSALPQTMGQFSTSTLNSFAQVVIWNTNSGNNASSDLVFNDASSTQNSYFAELGENGANYNQSAFSAESPHDLYALSSDGSVDIEAASTTSSNANINFLTGGTTAGQLRMKISSTGLVTIANGLQSQASSTIGDGTTVGGLTISGGATTTGQILAPLGSAAAASYSFTAAKNSGLYMADANTLDIDAGGSVQIDFNNSHTRVWGSAFIGSGSYLGWTSTSQPNASNPDVSLSRISPGVLAVGNTNAQGSTGGTLLDAKQGVGTTTPWGILSVSAPVAGTSSPLFVVASSTPSATTTAFMIASDGHKIASSTNPVLSSCGTGPTMLGDDTHGQVHSITSNNSGCVVTFQIAYAAPGPTCTASSETATSTFSYAYTATALTVTDVNLGQQKWDFSCEGLVGSQ